MMMSKKETKQKSEKPKTIIIIIISMRVSVGILGSFSLLAVCWVQV